MIAKEAIECYQLLGLDLWSSIPIIKKRYRELVLQLHPDRHQASPRKLKEGEEKLKRINPNYHRLLRHLEAAPSALHDLKTSAENEERIAKEGELRRAWRDEQERMRKAAEQRRDDEKKRQDEEHRKQAEEEKLRRQRQKQRKAEEKRQEIEKKTTRERWLQKVISMAQKGIPERQFALGQMFSSGHLVKKDETEAARWYRLAAELGFAQAQAELAFFYEWGKGVERDETAAARWYHEAACQGLADAQEHLGFLYSNGIGVEQDFDLAVRWYGMAARQGHADAQRELSECFSKGRGVIRDEFLAEFWRSASKYYCTK